MVTLQFPEQLKNTFKTYIIVFLSLIIVTTLLSVNAGAAGIDRFIMLLLIIALLSFITGIIGITKCLHYRQSLTLGQKIVGWTVSIMVLTVVIPLIISVGISNILMMLL